MSSENIEFVRELWEAVDRGGVEAALELTDPGVEWIPHPAAGRVLSTAELLRFLDDFEGERDRLTATPYSFRDHRNMVLASGSFRIHGSSGHLSEFQIHWVSEFDPAGRLVRARSFPTEVDALRAMGLDPARLEG
jgi:ketosteroid isomerase-like protein